MAVNSIELEGRCLFDDALNGRPREGDLVGVVVVLLHLIRRGPGLTVGVDVLPFIPADQATRRGLAALRVLVPARNTYVIRHVLPFQRFQATIRNEEFRRLLAHAELSFLAGNGRVLALAEACRGSLPVHIQ
jgi:hypothetical protein